VSELAFLAGSVAVEIITRKGDVMDHTWMRIAVDLAARVSGTATALQRRARFNNDEVMIEFS
jgi:hypothetical protein